VNFQLTRGPYAWLGWSWVGCGMNYQYPAALKLDYGEPVSTCTETSPNSAVFVRTFTKSKVTMDCNTWTPSVIMT
jgi:hypothetical protein